MVVRFEKRRVINGNFRNLYEKTNVPTVSGSALKTKCLLK